MSSVDDWGQGRYEVIAPTLEPSARHLVQLAAPRAGVRAIDLGSGTGNVSVLLAEAGADVTAIDPSLRLLGIAEGRALEAGLTRHTLVGSAESMPLPDGDAELILSNFGMVFTDHPVAAIGELMRVLAPGGRLLYTAWLPTGPIFEVANLIRAELGPRVPPAADPRSDPSTDQGAPAFDWHEPATFVSRIPGGVDAITTHSGSVEFSGESAEAWLEEMTTNQPMWLAARGQLDDEARWIDLMRRCTEFLESSAPGDGRFAVHSPYVAVQIWPQT